MTSSVGGDTNEIGQIRHGYPPGGEDMEVDEDALNRPVNSSTVLEEPASKINEDPVDVNVSRNKPPDMPDMSELLFTYGSVENFATNNLDPLGLPLPRDVASESDGDNCSDEDDADFDRIATERFMWESFYNAAQNKRVPSESVSQASSVYGGSVQVEKPPTEAPVTSHSAREFAVHQAIKFIQSKSKAGCKEEEDPNLFPNVIGSITKMTNVLRQIAHIQLRVKSEIQKAKRLTLIKEEIAKSYPCQEKYNYKAVVTKPYFKDKLGKGKMAFALLDPQITLPYRIPQKHVFSATELEHLTLCIHQAYFHRKAFLIDSRFTQYFMRIGLTEEEIMQLENLRYQLEVDLRKLESQKKTNSGVGYANKWRRLVNTFCEKDSGFINYLVASYKRRDVSLVPLQLARVKQTGIRAIMSIEEIAKYRSQELRTLYFNRQKATSSIEEGLVDWLIVARDMTEFCERNITADECERVYRICGNPNLNYSSETVAEIKSLKEAIKDENRDWAEIAQKINTNRPPIRVFHMYRRLLDNPDSWVSSIPNCNEEIALRLVNHCGDMAKVAEELSQRFGVDVNEKTLKAHWRHANPSFARGNYFLEEDGLLLAAMELLRDDILERGFTVVTRILPWRHCTMWRQRAVILFSHCTPNWTITEDKILLDLMDKGIGVKTIVKVLWKKNRSNCERRYLLLQKKLQQMTLEEYHIRYSTTTSNAGSMGCRRHSKIQLLLQKIIQNHEDSLKEGSEEKLDGNPTSCGYGSRADKSNPIRSSKILRVTGDGKTAEERKQDEKRQSIRELTASYHRQKFVWRPPNEKQCMDYLKTFPRSTLTAAYQRISNFLEGKVSFDSERNVRKTDLAASSELVPDSEPSNLLGVDSSSTGKADVKGNYQHKAFACDRRKFIRGDPISTASALHLRGMSLIMRDNEDDLNPWEKLVYSYYRVFQNSSRVKFTSKRDSIPTDLELSLMPELQNIIVYPKHFKVIKREEVVISDFTKDSNSAVFYEELKPDTFIPVTSEVLRAQKRIVERDSTGDKPKRTIKRVSIRNQKKAAAEKRWQNKKERERLTSLASVAIVENPLEILGPRYEAMDETTSNTDALKMSCVLHDHSYTPTTSNAQQPEDMQSESSEQTEPRVLST